MSLPRVIEYLLTVSTSTGNLVLQGLNQTIVNVPPLTRIVIQTEPSDTDFGEIGYRNCFDPQMVPSTVFTEGLYNGSKVYECLLTQYHLDNPIDVFTVITHQQRGIIAIENRTNLMQYYAGTIFKLIVPSEDLWTHVLDALRRLETSSMVEDLLSKMQGAK
jgi:hypothetical protein